MFISSKKIITFIFTFFVSTLVFSATRGAQELVPAGSWVYESFNKICIEQSVVNFSDSTPISIQQLKFYMSEINYDSLSSVGKAEYDKIYRYFEQKTYSFDSDLMSIGLEPSVNPEFYFKSNDDFDWVFDRYNRKGFFEIPLSITFGDIFAMNMDVSLKQNKGMSLHNDNYINLPLGPDQMDVNFPSYGYFSTGKKITDNTGIAFILGMGPRSVGNSLNGSIIMSEYLTGTSYAQLEAYSHNIKYTGSVAEFNVDKYLYLHQIDIRLFKKFTFSALEGMIVNAPFELRFINPLTVFHGYAPWKDYDSDFEEAYTGALFALKIQFVPFSGLKFYGNYAMTQFQTAYERSNWPEDVTPNGFGGQLGFDYVKPINNGYFNIVAEGYYATPYLYIKESPNWTFVRTYEENIGDKEIFYEWIGSPFGPDTISGEIKIGYSVPSKFSIDFIYLFMAKGEMSGTSVFNNLNWGGSNTEFDYSKNEDGTLSDDIKDWCYPDYDDDNEDSFNAAKDKQNKSTPSGTNEYINRISVKCKYFINDNISFTIQPSYVFMFNKNHITGEFDHGLEIALATSFRLAK